MAILERIQQRVKERPRLLKQEEQPEFYYCSNQDEHSYREIVQIQTLQHVKTGEDPKCPYCGRVMTYGRYW